MPGSNNISIWLKTLLYLYAIHSFTAGLLLIILPDSGLAYFGFNITNRFFTTQSGVFHIVMSVCYTSTALRLEQGRLMIIFIVIAKSIAAIFLFTYYFIIEHIMLILIFGIGDLLMAIILWVIYDQYKKAKQP